MRRNSRSSDLDDVASLFVSNTIDQVRAISAETAAEVAQTQRQLKELVGKRYRDLIDSCDRVVGMGSVCDRIQATWSEAKIHRHTHHDGGRHGKDRGDGQEGEDRETLHHLLLATTERINEVQALLDAQHISEATTLFNRTRQSLDQFLAKQAENGTPAQSVMLQMTQRRLSVVPAFILLQCEKAIAACARMPIGLALLQKYADVAQGLAAAKEINLGQAIDEVTTMHKDLVGSLHETSDGSAKETALLVLCALANCTHLHENKTSLPLVAKFVPMAPNDLSSLDRIDAHATASIMVSVTCTKVRPSRHSHVAHGPASDGAHADPELLAALDKETRTTLQLVLAEISTLEDIVEVEAAMLEHIDQLSGGASAASAAAIRSLRDFVQSAVSKRIEAIVRQLFGAASAACVKSCDATNASTGTTGKGVSWESGVDSNVIIGVLSAKRRKDGPKNASPVGSPTAPTAATSTSKLRDQLVDTFAVAARAVHRATALGPEPATAVLRHIQSGVGKMQSGIAQAIIKMTTANYDGEAAQEEKVRLMAHMSTVAYCLIENVVDFLTNLRGGKTEPSAFRAIDESLSALRQTYFDCHKPWITLTARSFVADVVAAAEHTLGGETDAAAFRRTHADLWTKHHVEGADVRVPRAATPQVVEAVHGLHLTLLQYRPWVLHKGVEGLLHATVLETLGTALAAAVSAAKPCSEDCLMQLFFDVRFVAGAVGVQAQLGKSPLAAVVQQLESRVDIINWSVSANIVDGAAQQALAASAVTLGAYGCAKTHASPQSSQAAASATAAAAEATMSIHFAAESERFVMLPITTPSATGVGSPSGRRSSNQPGPAGAPITGGAAAAGGDGAASLDMGKLFGQGAKKLFTGW